MYAPLQKKRKAVANSVTRNTSKPSKGLGLDHPPELIAQRKVLDLIDHKSRGMRLRAMTENNYVSEGVVQLEKWKFKNSDYTGISAPNLKGDLRKQLTPMSCWRASFSVVSGVSRENIDLLVDPINAIYGQQTAESNYLANKLQLKSHGWYKGVDWSTNDVETIMPCAVALANHFVVALSIGTPENGVHRTGDNVWIQYWDPYDGMIHATTINGFNALGPEIIYYK